MYHTVKADFVAATKTKFREMSDHELHAYAQTLAKRDRDLEALLLVTILEIKSRNLQIGCGYSGIADYCERALNMSEDQAWKRSRAATVIGGFPEFLGLFMEDQISISTLAVISAKITQANSEQFFAFVPGKSKRAVEAFTRRMGFNGVLAPETDDEVEFSVRIPRSLLDAIEEELHHLRRSRAGAMCSSKDELKRLLLEKACVHRKPTPSSWPGAGAGEEPSASVEPVIESASTSSAKHPEARGPGAGAPQTSNHEMRSRYIPAATRRAVQERDGGQCTFVSEDGVRCMAKHYLEMDHRRPYAWGVDHSSSNLRLLCRAHNQSLAEEIMGKIFMNQKRSRGQEGVVRRHWH